MAGERIKCFLLEELDPPRMRVWLRRYRSAGTGEKCPAPENWGYHNAQTLIGEKAARHEERDFGSGTRRVIVCEYGDEDAPKRDSPAWPSACACGYRFEDGDAWQVFSRELWRRADTGEVGTFEDFGPGAMWNAWWMISRPWDGEVGKHVGPDGRCLVVKTPGGEWTIDGPASNGPGWTRTGAAPRITARPSILAGKYHGFLTDGELVSV